jgi:hypothetical protein
MIMHVGGTWKETTVVRIWLETLIKTKETLSKEKKLMLSKKREW